MTDNNPKDAIEYIEKILDMDIPIVYYRLERFWRKHSVEINAVNMVEIPKRGELTLVSIDRIYKDNKVDITLNSYSLINYLPLIYHKKDFLKRYLFGVQAFEIPINDKIYNIDELFIAHKSDHIDWLSSWFGIKYGDLTDELGKRRIVANAIDLYKRRGTKVYFIKLIKAIVGVDIIIEDNLVLPQHTTLSKTKEFNVIIKDRISTDKDEEIRKYSIIKNIFEKEKPVNTKMNLIYDYEIESESIVEQKVISYDNYGYDYNYDT